VLSLLRPTKRLSKVMIKTQKSTVDIVDELRPVVMSSKPALQIIILSHRPVKTNEEIDAQLDKPLKLLLR
jgi:hypothetical protein